MKIGAITVTYNSGTVLNDFLASFQRQSYGNLMLYAIDNASTDDTVSQLKTWRAPNVQVIVNPENLGIATANNQGIRSAMNDGCDAVLLINNDTEFGPELVQNLVTGMHEYSCEAVTPKILFHDRPNVIWSAGGGFRPGRGYAAFHFGLNEVDAGQYETPRLVEHAPACCVLFRKEVFDQVGMIDNRYFIYVDDSDFSYRVMQAGLSIMYLPSAVLLHKASSLTGGPESRTCVHYRTRNQVYFMLKHLGILRGLFYVPAYQFYVVLQELCRRRSMLWLREKAIVEGLRLWRESLAE